MCAWRICVGAHWLAISDSLRGKVYGRPAILGYSWMKTQQSNWKTGDRSEGFPIRHVFILNRIPIESVLKLRLYASRLKICTPGPGNIGNWSLHFPESWKYCTLVLFMFPHPGNIGNLFLFIFLRHWTYWKSQWQSFMFFVIFQKSCAPTFHAETPDFHAEIFRLMAKDQNWWKC